MNSGKNGAGRRRSYTLATGVLIAFAGAGCGGVEVEDDPSLLNGAVEALGSTEPLQWVSTPAQLRAMTLTGNYALANDIEMAGQSFTPIGTPGSPFRGTFDGKNRVIKNLTLSRAGTSVTGLFGATQLAIVRNVGLTNVNITGGNATGAIIGVMTESDLTSSYVTGTVTTSGTTSPGTIGMAVGSMYGPSHISRCYATGTVRGTAGRIGGFVGHMSSCSNPSSLPEIREVFTNVTVSPTTNVGTYTIFAGGLVGSGSGGWIEDVSTVGNVTGRNYAGGVVGGFENLDLCPGGYEDILSRGIVTVSNVPNRAGMIGYATPGTRFFRCGGIWNSTTDGGTAPTVGYCVQRSESDSDLRAAHPAPNRLIWPFIHGALLPDGSGSDGDWGFGYDGETPTWALNSSTQHISLTRIPNPGVQPL
jgi:hypothetical protein